jgi:hypothetical protein
MRLSVRDNAPEGVQINGFPGGVGRWSPVAAAKLGKPPYNRICQVTGVGGGSSGTGWLHSQGSVLTAAHVVAGAASVRLRFAGQETWIPAHIGKITDGYFGPGGEERPCSPADMARIIAPTGLGIATKAFASIAGGLFAAVGFQDGVLVEHVGKRTLRKRPANTVGWESCHSAIDHLLPFSYRRALLKSCHWCSFPARIGTVQGEEVAISGQLLRVRYRRIFLYLGLAFVAAAISYKIAPWSMIRPLCKIGLPNPTLPINIWWRLRAKEGSIIACSEFGSSNSYSGVLDVSIDPIFGGSVFYPYPSGIEAFFADADANGIALRFLNTPSSLNATIARNRAKKLDREISLKFEGRPIISPISTGHGGSQHQYILVDRLTSFRIAPTISEADLGQIRLRYGK